MRESDPKVNELFIDSELVVRAFCMASESQGPERGGGM